MAHAVPPGTRPNGRSVNLRTFNDTYKAGKTLEDSAKATFTGREAAKKLGFSNVKFDKLDPDVRTMKPAEIEKIRMSGASRMQSMLSVASNERAGHSEAVAVAHQVVLPMHWCPPGRFVMGSAGHSGDEQAHEVTLTRGFWIARFPVTQEVWLAVMGDEFRFRDGPGSERLPVEATSYATALRFCDALDANWRARGAIAPTVRVALPTEAQWEYACRAGRSSRWWFGDDADALPDHAWYSANSADESHPVATKPANPWGLVDLYGNVAEWCRDDLRLWGVSALVDPLHDEGGTTKIVRGGGYTSTAENCRSASRGSLLVDNPYSEESGVRVVVVAR